MAQTPTNPPNEDLMLFRVQLRVSLELSTTHPSCKKWSGASFVWRGLTGRPVCCHRGVGSFLALLVLMAAVSTQSLDVLV